MPYIDLESDKSTAWTGYLSYEVVQDTTNNFSDISIKVWAQKEDGHSSGTNSGTFDASVTVAGTTKTLRSGAGFQLGTSGAWIGSDIGSDTVTFRVYHNSDGSVSCSISVVVTAPSGTLLSQYNLSYNGTLSIDSIPRSSAISSASDIYLGDNCKITWTPSSASFYYKLKFSFGTWSHTTSAFCPKTTSSYSYTDYQIPLDVASQIPSSIKGSMTVSLYAYENWLCYKQVGSTATTTFTVTVPDSVKPKITACTMSKDNSANSAVERWNIALSGYTRVKIAASAEGAYGSDITGFNITGSYTAAVTGKSLNYTGGVISSSGNKQFMITCTDSRGRTSDAFTTDIIQFLSYTQPRASKLTISKNSDNKMVATATWKYDSVNGNNSASAVVYYKVTSATDWTAHAGTPVNGSPFVLSNLTLDEESSYNFKVVVTDALGNKAEVEAFASTTRVLMDFQAGGRGLGIGKICEIDNEAGDTSSLEVSMDSHFWGNINLRNSALLVISPGMFGNKSPDDVFAEPVTGQVYFRKV